MKLTFHQKSVYGKTLFYPVDAASKAICEVARQKTMTVKDLTALEAGGFSIEVIQPVINFRGE